MMKVCSRCSAVVLGEPPLGIVLHTRQRDAYKGHQVKHDNANEATGQDSLYCSRLFTKSVYCITGERPCLKSLVVWSKRNPRQLTRVLLLKPVPPTMTRQ